MKKRRIISFIALALVALLFVGCKSNKAPDATPQSTPTPAADPAEPASTPQPAAPAANAVITVDFATEDAVRQYETVNFFTEPGREDGQKIIFTTDTPVTDVKYFSVSFTDTGDELEFSPAEQIYSVDELTPELPFVATWEDIGLIPARGFSYVDSDGTTKYFTISTSGEDGSVIISEFTPAQ